MWPAGNTKLLLLALLCMGQELNLIVSQLVGLDICTLAFVLHDAGNSTPQVLGVTNAGIDGKNLSCLP